MGKAPADPEARGKSPEPASAPIRRRRSSSLTSVTWLHAVEDPSAGRKLTKAIVLEEDEGGDPAVLPPPLPRGDEDEH